MFEIQGNGSFMPPEFWFALTILFGTAFVALLLWIVNRYLDQQKVRETKVDETLNSMGKLLHLHDHQIKAITASKKK